MSKQEVLHPQVFHLFQMNLIHMRHEKRFDWHPAETSDWQRNLEREKIPDWKPEEKNQWKNLQFAMIPSSSWSTSRITTSTDLWDHDWITLSHLKHLCSTSSIYQLNPIHRSILFFRRQSKQWLETPQKHTKQNVEIYTKHKHTWNLSKVWNFVQPKNRSPKNNIETSPIICTSWAWNLRISAAKSALSAGRRPSFAWGDAKTLRGCPTHKGVLTLTPGTSK